MINKQKLKYLKLKQKRDESIRIAFSSVSPPEIITEKELLKKSGLMTLFALFCITIFWFLFSIQSVFAYTGSGNPSDIKSNSFINSPVGLFPGTGTTGSASTSARFRWYYGTTSTTGTGSTGFFNPGSSTMTAGLPFIDFLFSNGSSSFDFVSFGSVKIDGVAIPSSGSVSDKLDAVGGVGTNNTFNNPTLAGVGTISGTLALTGTLSANSTSISGTEVSYLDNLAGNINTFQTAHAHGGTDSVKISHDNLVGTGVNSHAIVDTFIASKAQVSGLASLDANSLVVQNPTSGTSTPGASKIVMSNGTNKIADGWLSTNVPLVGAIELGTDTTGNTDNISEGSTNKYYTDSRVNAVIGSSSITSPRVSPKITFTSPASGQFLKIVDAQGNVENGTSSAVVDFSAVTGSATGNSNFKANLAESGKVLVGLSDIIYYPGTTTTIIGTSTNGRWYNLQRQAVGTFTYNTESGGTASASSTNPSYPVINAFDGTTTTIWASENPGFPIWIQYQYPDQHAFNALRLWNYAGDWGTFTVQASNNGSTFDSLGNFMSGTSTDNTLQIFSFSNSSSYSYWRLNHTSNPYRGDSYSALREIDFGNQPGTYNFYTAQYIPPGTSTPVLLIVDDGTQTANTYFLANVTTAIFGLGTTTAITGTTTLYRGWYDGPVRATAFNVASTEKIKENIEAIKTKPDWLDAESEAKNKYIADNKAFWVVSNQSKYTTVINETGTGTVTKIDKIAMESSYSNYIELQWASDLNQDAYTEDIQKVYEKRFWQQFDAMSPRSWNPKNKPDLTRRGFIVEESPDEVKGDDKQSIDPMALIAYMTKANQGLKADTVFALSILKKLITTGTVTQRDIEQATDRLDVLK